MRKTAIDLAIEQLNNEIAMLELAKRKLLDQQAKTPRRPRVVAPKAEKVG